MPNVHFSVIKSYNYNNNFVHVQYKYIYTLNRFTFKLCNKHFKTHYLL